MKAMIYTEGGGSGVLSMVDRDLPAPGPDEVLVRVEVSGVNPTDWKSRHAGLMHGVIEQVPNQDGAGVVETVGPGVHRDRVGERVWLWDAAWRRPNGTAQEVLAISSRQAVPLPEHASLDLGASLGIPALTAHRTLTVSDGGPTRLAPRALEGRTVLVAGGAGAVGNAAIQLARWAGATVVTTVSGPEKARLAIAAGAHHVVNYRTVDAVAAIRGLAPDGVDIVVEVAPSNNAGLDHAVAAPGATIAFYASGDAPQVRFTAREALSANLRWQGVLTYTVPFRAKDDAVAAVSAAVADRAFDVGESKGLPLHRYPLAELAQAHDAVEQGAVGKVLVDVPG